ncbi:MAG: hypothetical protein J2P46_13550, partial [Zavarzinella sp.]|nr:hypothetical protein [Zavarzinella sp.]
GASTTSGLSDPIVVWNDQVNRFIVGDQDVDNTNHVDTFDIAVSKSASPATLTTADWNFYRIVTTESGRNADYPGNFGWNADAFVFTLNQNQAGSDDEGEDDFPDEGSDGGGPSASGAGSAVQVVSVNMADLVAGNALTVGSNLFLKDVSGFSIRPTVMHDSVPGDPMWLLESTAGSDNKINVIKMTDVLSSSPTFTTYSRSVNAYQGVVQPQDPGGQITPNSGNNGALWTHILKAAEFNNTIVASDQISVSSTEDDARWYSISVADPNNPTIQDQGNVSAGDTNYVTFPSVDINANGDIGMTYLQSGTGANQFVSMYVTGRRAGDPAGTMETPVLVQAGLSNSTTGRLGDLTGINVDTDGSFYAGGEYRLGGVNAGLFGTEVGHFVLGTRPVVTAPSDQSSDEGAAHAFSLGSFSDPDDGPWSVDVNWGDGTPHTTFSAASAGSLGTRNHTYAEEGSYPVTVTVTDGTNLSASATFDVTVNDPPVVAGGVPITPVEGQDTGPVAVAQFTDPAGPEALGDYSAAIDWGDGTAPTAGTISFAGGVFTVSGNHTYAEESAADHPGSNPYQVTVTIRHDAAPDAVVSTTATVSDPAVAPTGGFQFVAVEGDPSATQTVATFTDPGGAEVLGDYSASIDWGDGTAPSAGTISLAGGVFTVTGSHTYATGLGTPGDFGNTFCDADPPSYHKPITVTISHEDAPDAVAVSDAKISLKPGSAHLASDGSLIVVGTPGDDTIVLNNVGSTHDTATVQLGSAVLGTFTVGPSGRIVVAAMGGDDSIQVAAGVRVEAVLYGGPGNDRLKGGGGRNILVGCEGDDTLLAGNLGDLMVGGAGADRIVGGNNNDLLVAGLLEDASNTEDDRYDDLVAILHAGTIAAPFHVADDGAVDRLTGSAGIDSFYGNFSGTGVLDIITDSGDVVFDI